MQPTARLEHIFSEDLGEVSVNKTPTAHTNLHRYPEYARYVSDLPKGTASIVYLILNILRVIFKNTEIIAPLNTTIWSVWQEGDPRTSNVFFADFNTTGISVTSRPKFSTELSQRKAAAFSIGSTVGRDYHNWVDASYIV